MIKHFNNVEDTLQYLRAKPAFVSGFTSALRPRTRLILSCPAQGFAEGGSREGCFTAYLGIDTDLTWGLQPSCEFSITQNSGDLVLLEAFNQFFNTRPTAPYPVRRGWLCL